MGGKYIASQHNYLQWAASPKHDARVAPPNPQPSKLAPPTRMETILQLNIELEGGLGEGRVGCWYQQAHVGVDLTCNISSSHCLVLLGRHDRH